MHACTLCPPQAALKQSEARAEEPPPADAAAGAGGIGGGGIAPSVVSGWSLRLGDRDLVRLNPRPGLAARGNGTKRARILVQTLTRGFAWWLTAVSQGQGADLRVLKVYWTAAGSPAGAVASHPWLGDAPMQGLVEGFGRALPPAFARLVAHCLGGPESDPFLGPRAAAPAPALTIPGSPSKQQQNPLPSPFAGSPSKVTG